MQDDNTTLSNSQLVYVLQRMFRGIQLGVHFSTSESVDIGPNGAIVGKKDAHITEWNLNEEQPSNEEIMRVWKEVEDEYWGDPISSTEDDEGVVPEVKRTNI